jgi:hypothetical protein
MVSGTLRNIDQSQHADARPSNRCSSSNAKSKPRAKPKKTGPAIEGTPTEEASPAPVFQSAFSIGDSVHHPIFGDGKIENIEDDKFTIKFEGNVTKIIREDFGGVDQGVHSKCASAWPLLSCSARPPSASLRVTEWRHVMPVGNFVSFGVISRSAATALTRSAAPQTPDEPLRCSELTLCARTRRNEARSIR